jgi:anti-sigma factor ChrR (cupin superfamily)
MLIHADMTRRAVSFADEAQWVPSPMAGVERRMLERDGDEVARATSVVRYRAGSRFPHHEHALGEEFLVLDGTFADERGEYPAGTYVRNPPGSGHAPWSEDGVPCSLISGNSIRRTWNGSSSTPARRSGFPRSPKASPSCRYTVSAASGSRWSAGRRRPASSPTYTPGEEIFVLDGAVEDEEGRYAAGSWLRNPPGSQHAPFSLEGCLLYVKIRHLPAVVT